MTPKQRLHATLAGEPRDRVPVTPIFMSWAAHHIGRSYRDYYLDGRVLAEAQLAIARDFQVDQVSAISDPWREADAMGMHVDYPPEGVGVPRAYLLRQREDFKLLERYDPLARPRTHDRIAAVHLMARAAGQTHSVLGWVEAPLAEYADLRGLDAALLDLMDEPALFHEAAEVLLENAIAFARAGQRRRRHHRRGRRGGQPHWPGALHSARATVANAAVRGDPRSRRQGQAAHLRQHARHPGGDGADWCGHHRRGLDGAATRRGPRSGRG